MEKGKGQKNTISKMHRGYTGFEKPGYLTIKPNPVGFSGLTRILLGNPGEYQGLRRKGRIPTDDLIPKNRNAEIITYWHFIYPQLVQMLFE